MFICISYSCFLLFAHFADSGSNLNQLCIAFAIAIALHLGKRSDDVGWLGWTEFCRLKYWFSSHICMNCEFRFLIKSENYAIWVYIWTLLGNCSMSWTNEHSVCFHSTSGHLVKGLTEPWSKKIFLNKPWRGFRIRFA